MSDEKNKAIYEQKCVNCGAPLVYDPNCGKMYCAWCGSYTELEEITQNLNVHIQRAERDHVLETMEPLPIYTCESCGADVIAANEQGALTCPYCKNHIVLTRQFSGTIKPDGIIPFKIKPEKLASSVKSYCGKYKMNLPRNFITKSKIGSVTGIYVPFWVFDCDVAGEVVCSGSTPGKSYTSGGYRYSETEHYRLERVVSMSFENLAVDASKKMADDLMDSIQPYDFAEAKPFDVRYLAGFVADRFDESSEDSKQRNDKRVLNSGVKAVVSKVSRQYSGVGVRSNQLNATLRSDRYMLLPVYLMNIMYEGINYTLAMNGQTGKVVGKLPYKKEKEKTWFWWFFGGGFAVTAALLWFFFVR